MEMIVDWVHDIVNDIAMEKWVMTNRERHLVFSRKDPDGLVYEAFVVAGGIF